MKIRTRLIWSFAAMLLVPLFLFLLLGGIFGRLTNTDFHGGPRYGTLNLEGGLEALNGAVLEDPDSLLVPDALNRLREAFPQGLALGVYAGGELASFTGGFIPEDEGFAPAARFHKTPEAAFSWGFRLSDGTPARVEIRRARGLWLSAWGSWAALGTLAGALILVLTNGILSLTVSRSILRPLRLLEEAARRVGEGDLEEGKLPSGGDEFGDVGLAFDDMRTRLKASLEKQNELEEDRRTWVASVSHDIRTPLAVLKGYAEGLRDGVANTPEKRRHYVGVLLDRAALMERLVDDLFHWARWDWGDPSLKLERVDLAKELDNAVAAWRIDWPTLRVVWDKGPQTFVLADRWALARVFDNLARNAAHHAGPSPTLTVTLSEVPSGARIVFADDGPGISAEVLPRVFERFYRGDDARQATRGGGGLGLTIAQSLLKSFGATIRAESGEGLGARFIIDWPAPGDRP